MLVKQNQTNKYETKYECDRCGRGINSIDRTAIYVAVAFGQIHKRWDFCPKCYKALERGVEK